MQCIALYVNLNRLIAARDELLIFSASDFLFFFFFLFVDLKLQL